MILEGLHYTKEHEWVKIEGDVATVGVADYAQDQMGELTYVELPESDRELKVHSELAVLESSKAASDVYSPVAGEVIETNSQLESQPNLINDDCYGQGWIAKIKLSDKSAQDQLMNSEQYGEYVKSL